MPNIIENSVAYQAIETIRDRITQALNRAGRSPESLTLIAVSKTKAADQIQPVIEAGQSCFGENYVQEAQAKWPAMLEGDNPPALHMIGPLQSNKVNAALRLFSAIHTLDRISLAKKLSTALKSSEHHPELFIQVNTGGEEQKAGIFPEALPAFHSACSDLGLSISGLMCIPPEAEDPVPHFRMLRELAKKNGLDKLSMGMSNDFEAAIAEGATHIRIGSAIFGARIA